MVVRDLSYEGLKTSRNWLRTATKLTLRNRCEKNINFRFNFLPVPPLVAPQAREEDEEASLSLRIWVESPLLRLRRGVELPYLVRDTWQV